MKSVCIKSNNAYVIDYLLKDFSNLNIDNIYLSNRNFKIYENVILHYTGEDINIFYDLLCDRLTKCILFFYEKKLIKNILQYNYFYFNDIEKQQILENCQDLFIVDEDLNLLDENIDLSVNNFLIEREYYEFINILHLYVNSKESTMDVVHLVYTNKDCILLDKNKNIIPLDNSLLDAKYLSDISFSSNDYCLNALLNILPKKLYIHLINNYEDEFITTLKLIFV